MWNINGKELGKVRSFLLNILLCYLVWRFVDDVVRLVSTWFT